jgi:hypothetical protein
LKNGSGTVDHTPSAECFFRNSSTSKRINRNRLTAPPAASSLAQSQLDQYGNDRGSGPENVIFSNGPKIVSE